jgi:hypothetical protein
MSGLSVAKGGAIEPTETRANWPVIDNYLLFSDSHYQIQNKKHSVFQTSVSVYSLQTNEHIIMSDPYVLMLHTTWRISIAFYMKMAVFWVVAPCSLVEVYHVTSLDHGGSKHH